MGERFLREFGGKLDDERSVGRKSIVKGLGRDADCFIRSDVKTRSGGSGMGDAHGCRSVPHALRSTVASRTTPASPLSRARYWS